MEIMFQQTIFDKKSKKIKTDEDFKRPNYHLLNPVKTYLLSSE